MLILVLLGRTVGLVFAVPFLYFLARGRLSAPLRKRLLLIAGMGGCQGLVGWWMVKSGLEEHRFEHDNAHVHVSPYRLCFHLISAFAIYAALFTTAMQQWPSARAVAAQVGE